MSSHLDEEQIHLFLDGMLGAAAREKAENHLAMCARCRAELTRWHELFVALDILAPARTTSDILAGAVLGRASLTVARDRRQLWSWLAAQGVAAAVLLLL